MRRTWKRFAAATNGPGNCRCAKDLHLQVALCVYAVVVLHAVACLCSNQTHEAAQVSSRRACNPQVSAGSTFNQTTIIRVIDFQALIAAILAVTESKIAFIVFAVGRNTGGDSRFGSR